jgi:hypothetical protein
MTAARWSGGIAADSARSAPRNARPKPAPPTTEPTRSRAAESVEAATTMIAVPAASATDPPAAPTHGARRPKRSCAAEPQAARTKMLMPVTMWLVVSNRVADSCGPSERNRPPTDHDESTASAARRNGRRTPGGTLGRCGVRRRRERAATGSGMSSAPVKAMAKRTNSTT